MRTWNFYTAKELHPEGRVRRQLEIQAEDSRVSGCFAKGEIPIIRFSLAVLLLLVTHRN